MKIIMNTIILTIGLIAILFGTFAFVAQGSQESNISIIFGDVPLIDFSNGTQKQVITPYSTDPKDLTHLHNTTFNQLCPSELNTSNFTQKIWSEYCIDPQTDKDYNGQ